MPHENDPTRATALDDKRRARIGRNVVSVTPTNKREALRALINEEEGAPRQRSAKTIRRCTATGRWSRYRDWRSGLMRACSREAARLNPQLFIRH